MRLGSVSHHEVGTGPLDAGGRGAELETDPPAERACQELGELSVEPGEELVGELDDDGAAPRCSNMTAVSTPM